MTPLRAVALCVVSALAACGGGAVQPHATVPVAPASKVAIAYGTLTLRFPPNVRVASGVKRTTAVRIHPTYLNPNGGTIEVFIGGTLWAGVTVAPGLDGTQVVPNVPLYSTTSDVAAIEYDASADVLAVGETPNVTVVAGSVNTITLTMQMNATGFALSLSPTGTAAMEMTGAYLFGSTGPQNAYVYPTDPTGSFVGAVPAVGVGGLPTNLTVYGAAATNGASFAQGSLGYAFNLAGINDGITMTAVATNPAAVAAADSTDYPVISGLAPGFVPQLQLTDVAIPTNIVPSGFLAPAGYVWIASRANGVLAWPMGASGNVAPTVILSGARTNLTEPVAFTIDAVGNLYAANDSASGLELFGPIANGNVPPLLSFTSTSPLATEGAVIDTQRNMYVASYGGAIGVFAPGSSGVTAPIRLISGPSTQLQEPIGITLDSAGDLFVADANAHAIFEFAPGANGNATPIAVIQGPATGFVRPEFVAIDNTGKIIVGDEDVPTISIFASGANGNVAPVTTISGAATGIGEISGVTTDNTNHIWVCDNGAQSISRFAPGASGNATPVQVIQGAATLIFDPFNVQIH